MQAQSERLCLPRGRGPEKNIRATKSHLVITSRSRENQPEGATQPLRPLIKGQFVKPSKTRATPQGPELCRLGFKINELHRGLEGVRTRARKSRPVRRDTLTRARRGNYTEGPYQLEMHPSRPARLDIVEVHPSRPKRLDTFSRA